jgi:small subunit ribosomal protein S7
LRRGKKTVAFNIFYDTIDKISDQTKESGFDIWKKAVDNLQPSVEVKSRRIGGANFQIPTEVRPARKIALAMQWLIQYAKERNGKSMADKLAAETIAASKGEGAAFKKKEDVHKMAEANKAFAHFRV